jgi:hypothetical protein
MQGPVEERKIDQQQYSGLLVSVSSFLVMLLLQSLVKNAIAASRSVCAVLRAVIGSRLLVLARVDEDDRDDVGTAPPRLRHCEQCARRGTSISDVAAVVASLGLMDDDDRRAAAMAVVDELTESKVAGEAELREAFYVFDRDGDRFVTPAELWSVMRRLAVQEGALYEDCGQMVAVQDGDGDGRVSFREFRAMMESAA